MAYDKNRKNQSDGGYMGTGVNSDTAMNVTQFGRAASDFLPGGAVVKGGVDIALAGVQGDIEGSRDIEHMQAAGIDVNDSRAKWNPAIKSRMQKINDRFRGRLGEAGLSAAAGGLGAWGGAAAGAAIGTTVAPVVGTTVGGAMGWVGGAFGTMAAGYAGSRVYNYFDPLDEKDEVDLTLKIVDAQKAGQEVPPEAIFAQWAAKQRGSMDKRLKADLQASTGLTNFNDAVEQGRSAELNALMNKFEYSNAMRANMGLLPDAQNPDKHVAEQVSEWINSGQMEGKDLLLGRENMPMMSLADARREGYVSDTVTMPSMPMMQQGRGRSPDYSMSV